MTKPKSKKAQKRIESQVSVPNKGSTKDISAKILTSISKAVHKPFTSELTRWMNEESERRTLSSSLSVSIYSDITFWDDGESLGEPDDDDVAQTHMTTNE